MYNTTSASCMERRKELSETEGQNNGKTVRQKDGITSQNGGMIKEQIDRRAE